jgi:translation initiation factor IF-2
MTQAKGQDDDNTATQSSGRRTLQLKKPVEGAPVRPSSAGRNKVVVVEKKRRRMARDPRDEGEGRGLSDVFSDSGNLTRSEMEARAKALEDARQRAQDEARQKAEDEARRAVEAAEEARRVAEEAASRATEAPAQETPAPALPQEPAAADAAPGAAPRPGHDAAHPRPERLKADEERETRDDEARGKKALPKVADPRKGERRRGKLTLTDALQEEEGEERQRSLASVRRARERQKALKRQAHEPPTRVVRDVVIPEAITVQDLASRMAERGSEVIKALMRMGIMATINQPLDADTAELVVEEFGHKSRRVAESDVEIGVFGDKDDPALLKSRPPVVTVMGHVDHGKTSLLDAIRQADVVSGEAGGITQHIGAYQVTLPEGNKITFIDTPGHAAFTAMRARGAKVTDIVVLVVAADDSVMPQTIEAIQHAKAAKVPMIVAINKVDKPDADPARVRQELLQHEVFVEQMGGDVLDVEVSAKNRTNLDKLLEAIALQAELMELKANPDRPAEGVVIESKLEKGRGPVATILVQRGTMRIGDIFVAGAQWGRVRALLDERGQPVKEALPAQPVEVLGLSGAPEAGDEFSVVEDEGRAREITAYRQRQINEKRSTVTARTSLESMFTRLKEDQTKELAVVVKADVQGSLEAIIGSLEKLGTDEVAVRVVYGGVGGITESDINLAQASQSPVIGFNVRATSQARDLAEREGIEIRYYSIIYDLVDEIKSLLSGMLAPRREETAIGMAEVKEVFKVTKVGWVAGCLVTDGHVRRDAHVRVLRDDIVIHDGVLASLRRFKDEVKEVVAGTECGIAIANFQDVKAGDTLEIYEVEEVQRTL